MTLVAVRPVADPHFFAPLRASNILIARQRRRAVLRFLGHAGMVAAVLIVAITYLNVAAAGHPALMTAGSPTSAPISSEAATSPAEPVVKAARVVPL